MNTSPSLLIVDGEPETCRRLGATAERAGFVVRCAHSSAEILSLWQQGGHADLLLLDLAMPDTDGIEILRHWSGHRPSLILMSGLEPAVLEAARRLAQSRGFTVIGVLGKPVRPEALLELLSLPPQELLPSPVAMIPLQAACLARALERDELLVHVQPQVSLETGEWLGLEALARWQHPELGLIYPDDFIALAEASGQALALTRLVAEKALAIAVAARDELGFTGYLSINLSPVSLVDLGFPDEMARLVLTHGWEASRLRFELTESSVPVDRVSGLDILTRLRLKNFSLSIDDFGTGHSTMEGLHQSPVSEIKIDMSFVQPALTNFPARTITEKSIGLGRQLGLTTVAEGVESAGHWRWLRSIGCEVAQGFYISRPIPGSELAGWYEGWQTSWKRELALMDPALIAEQEPGCREASILLVDDASSQLRTLAMVLARDGYDVSTAPDGEAAWQLLTGEGRRFDVVITDRVMPGLDGLSLLKRIKLDPALKHLPVIFQTAMDGLADIIEGISAGVYYYLTKPVNSRLMLAVVQASMEEVRRYDALREESARYSRGMNLIRHGAFRVRTLKQALDLAPLLASACAEPEIAVIGLAELLLNAVEHGNLGITYEEKGALVSAGRWQDEVELRLALPQQQERFVEIDLECDGERVSVCIRDQGEGFDAASYLDFQPERATHAHGRGIAMARLLSFDSLEYLGCGNAVVAKVRAAGSRRGAL